MSHSNQSARQKRISELTIRISVWRKCISDRDADRVSYANGIQGWHKRDADMGVLRYLEKRLAKERKV